jgi:hypothetical protein
MPRPNKNEGVVSQPAHSLVYRRAAELRDLLQILDCQETAWLKLTANNQILQAFIS